jgi:hypothetical protein
MRGSDAEHRQRQRSWARLAEVTLLAACLWGLAGAAAIEVSELYTAIRSVKNFPWRCKGEVPLGPYLFSVVLRLGLGAFAAALCAKAGPLGPAGAVAAGIAAPKLLEQLGRHHPSVGTLSDTTTAAISSHPAKLAPHPPAKALGDELPATADEGGAADGSD